jgi:hypothetical protein
MKLVEPGEILIREGDARVLLWYVFAMHVDTWTRVETASNEHSNSQTLVRGHRFQLVFSIQMLEKRPGSLRQSLLIKNPQHLQEGYRD